MREIRVRGLTQDNERIYGTPIYYHNGAVAIVEVGNYSVCAIQVGDSSIEQFTGLCDKNGQKIYEGDIVRVVHDDGTSGVAIVKYIIEHMAFEFEVFSGDVSAFYAPDGCDEWADGELEVVGNTFDNPELIKLLGNLDG